jgi:regulator of sirC expression with transglutaminase-like and TPR domain
MSVALHLHPRAVQVAAELEQAMNAPGDELAPAAFAIARVEYPGLDPAPYLALLDEMGDAATARLGSSGEPTEDALRSFNEFFYDELGFTGNRERYDDPRNSFLNEVLTRRTGIPISLAVVYLEVARRAGLRVAGINFPGHFLLRAPVTGPHAGTTLRGDALIVDPFHRGALLSEADCRELLRQHVGDDAAFDRTLLDPATRTQIVVRILVNLKRLYVRMRSFPQARFISDLLLAADPSAILELRDRGLLAYHLQDFAGALRDLEAYLRLLPKQSAGLADDVAAFRDESDEGEREQQPEHEQIWEHVKTLRKRVAGFN